MDSTVVLHYLRLSNALHAFFIFYSSCFVYLEPYAGGVLGYWRTISRRGGRYLPWRHYRRVVQGDVGSLLPCAAAVVAAAACWVFGCMCLTPIIFLLLL